MSNEVVAAPAATLLTVGDASSSIFSGSLTGPLALKKTGAGVLELSGSNSNTGATTVSGGTLDVSGTLTATTGVTVNTGGTLLLSGASGEQVSDTATVGLGGGTLAFNHATNQIETLGALTLSVNSTLDFNDQHLVINGASDLVHQLFGKEGDGWHARSALGFASLPTGPAAEVEAIFEIKGT